MTEKSEFEIKEREIEERLSRLEEMEREMLERMREIENRLGVKKRPMRQVKKRTPLREIEKEFSIKAPHREEKKSGERIDMLREQIKRLVEKHISDKDNGVNRTKAKVKSEKERREILKKQIRDVIERYKKGKKEVTLSEKGIPVENLKITDKDVKDARILFELLLHTGSIKLEEATEKLKVERKTVEGWADDLEGSGLIEVIKYPNSTELRLKDISVALKKS